MFRELYKEANDNIKGDRAILDKAFLKAAQPKKTKSPLLRYSFVGTAAAAVLVLGAVFLNVDVFMEKTKNMPVNDEINRQIITPTEKINESHGEFQDENSEDALVTIDMAVEETENDVAASMAENENVAVMRTEDYGLAVASEGTDEAESDEVGFSLRIVNAQEIDAGEVPDDEDEALAVNEKDETKHATGAESAEYDIPNMEKPEEDGINVKVFSYMYDISLYKCEQGEYKNTDVCPIKSVEEAIERAKGECIVEYDTVVVYRDNIEDIWKICFYKADTLGGGQDVYINSDGITQLIVFGE